VYLSDAGLGECVLPLTYDLVIEFLNAAYKNPDFENPMVEKIEAAFEEQHSTMEPMTAEEQEMWKLTEEDLKALDMGST
jgi:hypothetical protein